MDGNNITWATLTELEPRLRDLYNYATEIRDMHIRGSYFCANLIWARALKPRLNTMVGFEAFTDDEILTSPAAYELAIDVIYNQLPACRACACV